MVVVGCGVVTIARATDVVLECGTSARHGEFWVECKHEERAVNCAIEANVLIDVAFHQQHLQRTGSTCCNEAPGWCGLDPSVCVCYRAKLAQSPHHTNSIRWAFVSHSCSGSPSVLVTRTYLMTEVQHYANLFKLVSRHDPAVIPETSSIVCWACECTLSKS